ncbi:MAG: GreA/GreB family elongation factor, partial [Actinomycetaceae bacterium]
NAQVGDAPADDGVVEPGMVITAKIAGKKRTFLLGSREAAEGLDVEVFSESSPLGQALVGRSAGETTSYEAPNGATITVELEKVKPFKI